MIHLQTASGYVDTYLIENVRSYKDLYTDGYYNVLIAKTDKYNAPPEYLWEIERKGDYYLFKNRADYGYLASTTKYVGNDYSKYDVETQKRNGYNDYDAAIEWTIVRSKDYSSHDYTVQLINYKNYEYLCSSSGSYGNQYGTNHGSYNTYGSGSYDSYARDDVYTSKKYVAGECDWNLIENKGTYNTYYNKY